jgi:hypothetical protein
MNGVCKMNLKSTETGTGGHSADLTFEKGFILLIYINVIAETSSGTVLAFLAVYYKLLLGRLALI